MVSNNELINLILDTDSYKAAHWLQYPPKTTRVFSYIESRGGKFDKTVMFGLQYIIKTTLLKPITQQDINEAEVFFAEHFGRSDIFNKAGWQYILEKHGGNLPIAIHAVPEGSVIPGKNILVAIENTDPENTFWLTSYLETLLMRVWYPITITTNSYRAREVLLKYLEMTGDPSLIDFKLHDFGARGVSCKEQAGIGGMSHLVSFMGSDTLTGIVFARKYYNTNAMVGFSIPAAEHSTMTSWGGKEGEVKSMKNMLDKFIGQNKMVAVVSDSYDIFNACIQHWGTTLRHQIEHSGGVLVIRPDSGDPVEVTLRVVELLGEKFGFAINEKGYKVLKPCVRIIQGDGIDLEMIEKILANYAKHGWSADNIAFGSGGGLLQKFDRDTLKFAMKCSAIQTDGEWVDVFKDPITDPGKKSKRGRLTLIRNPQGEIMTVREGYAQLGSICLLKKVYENGKLFIEFTFEEVRANVKAAQHD